MTRFRIILSAVALALTGAVVWLGFRIGSDSGSLTDWLALVVALVGLVLTGFMFGEQQQRERKAQADHRGAQADKVTGWGGEAMWRASTPTHVTWKADGTQVTTEGDGPILLEWCDLYSHNASDMPVRAFAFEFYVREEGSDTPYVFAGSHPVGVLMPGQTELRLKPAPGSALLQTMAETMRSIPNNSIQPPQFRVGYTFTDNAGLRWRHDVVTGRAEEVQA